MRVLFIKPSWPYPYSQNESTYNRIWAPLELANCAAILERHGLTPVILDCHALRIKPHQIKHHIGNFDRIFITSSSRDRWQCPNIDISPFLAAAREIKKFTDNVYVMGYHGTMEPAEILNSTGARAVIRGEPEGAVLDICRTDDISKVQGIAFISNGTVTCTPDRKPIDLQTLPIPAFHLLNLRKYSCEIFGGNPFFLFEISRGCEFRCTFCNQTMYGDRVRSKSAEQVQAELQIAIEKYNIRTGCFMDLHFLTNRKVVNEVCDFLIKQQYNFTWTCSTRADSLDRDILLKMKAAGCRLVKMGVETGQQVLLDSVNKSLDLTKVEEAFQLCRSVGVQTLAFFLFGIPGETKEDREANLKFSKKLNPDFISFHKVIPYKGTTIAKRDFTAPDKDLLKMICRAYKEYYLRPSYLVRLPPSIYLASFRLFLGRLCTLS